MKYGSNNDIEIDSEVLDYLNDNPGKYRLCTSCGGPALVPEECSAIKLSDILIELGKSTIYFSQSQYRWGLRNISMEMLERNSCS
jgi:hypothetical protein